MTALRHALDDYLAVRRVLGYRLVRTEKLLAQFLAYLEDRGEERLTAGAALAWATLPPGADRSWASARLSVARRFAVHVRGIDPASEVPPTDLLPGRTRRAARTRWPALSSPSSMTTPYGTLASTLTRQPVGPRS